MGGECIFCYEPRGLIRTGCACRGECAVVHARCLVRAVLAAGLQEAWIRCRLCKQEFTGVAACALARARAREPRTAHDAFYADVHAIDAMCEAQKPIKAETLARALLTRTVEQFGTESDAAALVELRVAIALMQQAQYAEAERLAVIVLRNQALYAQTTTILARIMHITRRYAEAERYWRLVPDQDPGAAIITRVLLCETLAASQTLHSHELDAALADARRVFGAEHAVTRKAMALVPQVRAAA